MSAVPTPELDLFGVPVKPESTKAKPGYEVDPVLADSLLVQRKPTPGPTHRVKTKTAQGTTYQDGPTKTWLPPRGDGRMKVMIVGLHPADSEKDLQAILVGPTGTTLERILGGQVGIRMTDCYLTNLIKYHFPAGTAVPKEAVDICLPYFEKEVEEFKPELILCLGSEVFCHINETEGNVDDYRGSLLKHEKYGCDISVVWLPTVILTSPEKTESWVIDLKSVFKKNNVPSVTNWEDQDSLEQVAVNSIEDLRAAVDRELARNTMLYALDTEFDGETWYDANMFKLVVSTNACTYDFQFTEPKQGYAPRMFKATKGRHKHSEDISIAEKRLFNSEDELQKYIKDHPLRTKPIAAYVRDYVWVFKGTPEEVGHELNRMMCRPGVKIWGQNARVDYKLLLRLGVNLFPYVELDTVTLALHLNESQSLGLEDLSKTYLGAPNHKIPLIHWLNKNTVVHDRLPYSFVPRHIMDPYARTDGRRTYDLRQELLNELGKQEAETIKRKEPSLKDAYFVYKMGQYQALAEMEITGQPVNLTNLLLGIDWYDQARKDQMAKCVAEVERLTGLKNFSPYSPTQVKSLLFDILKLKPLYSTDKPPVPWDKVEAKPIEEQGQYTPSTNQETLETLAIDNDVCALVNNTRLISTISKNYLRRGARWAKDTEAKEDVLELFMTPEQRNQAVVEEANDSEEGPEFWAEVTKDKSSRALSQVVNPNSFLYSSYFELLETHRLATRPNISAIPKGESKYIKDIVGSEPPCELRWLFEAPDDWVIAEADWVTGEVWFLMTIANDQNGIRAISDPEKYDVHSAMAKRMFSHTIPSDMPEPEVKKKFKRERDAAKPVTFGVPYQRGPEAIARQLNREAANQKQTHRYTKEDGAKFINAYKEEFPMAWQYLETQMQCVSNPRYQTSPWGFRRRYPYATDKTILNKLQREASNWQIQHGIACCMMMSCRAWTTLRAANPDIPVFLIDILHDATKWLIHKSVLDLAPKIISAVMGDALVFPSAFKDIKAPLRHEITFYKQWGGKAIPDAELAKMHGAVVPSHAQIARDVPTFPYLQKLI